MCGTWKRKCIYRSCAALIPVQLIWNHNVCILKERVLVSCFILLYLFFIDGKVLGQTVKYILKKDKPTNKNCKVTSLLKMEVNYIQNL